MDMQASKDPGRVEGPARTPSDHGQWTYWKTKYNFVAFLGERLAEEELLALGERIGSVNTGLSEDMISNCITAKAFGSSNGKDERCAICLGGRCSLGEGRFDGGHRAPWFLAKRSEIEAATLGLSNGLESAA